MTNGDRIRQMSNEELAEYLNLKTGLYNCYVCKNGFWDYQFRECEYSDVDDRDKCIEGIKAYLESEEK